MEPVPATMALGCELWADLPSPGFCGTVRGGQLLTPRRRLRDGEEADSDAAHEGPWHAVDTELCRDFLLRPGGTKNLTIDQLQSVVLALLQGLVRRLGHHDTAHPPRAHTPLSPPHSPAAPHS